MKLSWSLAVADAMTDIEHRVFMERFLAANPHWNGAQAADVLEALCERDSNLDQVEPFFERFPEFVMDGGPETARALIWSAQPLLPETFAALHGRAAQLVALRKAEGEIHAGLGLTPDEVREHLGRRRKGPA